MYTYIYVYIYDKSLPFNLSLPSFTLFLHVPFQIPTAQEGRKGKEGDEGRKRRMEGDEGRK